jgi:predicted house-cleaning NTP pyrophosphatase (Maf/HAM1 superfamily)
MAKAQITTPEGIKVNIDGTPREIAAVLEDLKKKAAEAGLPRRRAKAKPGRVLLGDLLASLKDGGFFKKPRDLASVKSRLAEMGHHYPITTLSPVMLRQVRRRNLRRIREKGRWLYTG